MDKVTEIFCMADDFCKFFDAMTIKYTLKPTRKRIYQALPEPMVLQRGTSYKINVGKTNTYYTYHYHISPSSTSNLFP